MEGRQREPEDPRPPRAADLVHGGPYPGLREPFRGHPRRDARSDHARTRTRAVRRCARCRRPGRPVGTQLPARDRGRGPRRDLRRAGAARSVGRRRPGPRTVGRLRQPSQGRRDERGRSRRGAPRAWLGPPGCRSRRSAVQGSGRHRGHGVTDVERQVALEAIAADVRACTNCRLHETRTHAVPGEGAADTEVVFVGEGPGEHEDRQGRPFIGASGLFLTELIGSIGWARDDVFITNVVKCRPPGNREPQPDEIAACSVFLRRQLEVLDPAVVVTAGKHSLASFRPNERISAVHGTTAAIDPATGARDAVAFAMYHPAFALYQASNRQTLLDDIQLLPAALIDSRRRRDSIEAVEAVITNQPASEPEPELGPAFDSTTAAAAADDPTPQLTLF